MLNNVIHSEQFDADYIDPKTCDLDWGKQTKQCYNWGSLS